MFLEVPKPVDVPKVKFDHTPQPPRENSKFSDDPRVSNRQTDFYLPPISGTRTKY